MSESDSSDKPSSGESSAAPDATAAPAEAAAPASDAVSASATGADGANASAAAPDAANGEGEIKPDLDRVLEIPLTMKVEVGSTRMQIEELLNLGPGSVIELDKRAGEPVDILVADKMIATGDAVVVNEYFGVKIQEIISQKERVKSLA